MSKRLFSIFVFTIALGNLAYAEESLNLGQALFIAHEDNPTLQEKKQDFEAKVGHYSTEFFPEGPEVSFEIGGFKKQEIDGEEVTPDKNLDSFEITQSFDLPPTWFLKRGIAEDDIKIAEGEMNVSWLQIRAEIKTVFAAIIYAEESFRVHQSNLDAARQFLDRVEVKFQSGNASKAERIRANIELLKAQSELVEAENVAKSLKARLNLLLGRSWNTEFSVDEKFSYDAVEFKRDALIQSAFLARPDYLNQKVRLSQASKEKQKAWFEILPKPFIGFTRTDEDFEKDYSIVLGGKFTSWDLNFGAIKEKAALEEKERIRLKASEREIESEIESKVRELQNIQRKVEIYKKATEEANELLREVTLQYEEGDVNFLSYLENLKAIKEARLFYFEILKDYSEHLSELERVTQAAKTPERNIA